MCCGSAARRNRCFGAADHALSHVRLTAKPRYFLLFHRGKKKIQYPFTIVSLLLALMTDLCLPLSEGEDTFKLHLVQLEAVERRIHDLLGKQAQLRKRKATLETSRADAHKSGVSKQRAANISTTSTPCVSLHRPRAPGT